MSVTVTPFLMFQGEAEEALTFYIETIPGSKLVSLDRHGDGTPGFEGKVMQAVIELAGQRLRILDSPIPHDFTFTPAVSLFIECDTEETLDQLIAKLGDGGSFLMPPDNYGFSQKYAWLNDRYGVSWQVNLP